MLTLTPCHIKLKTLQKVLFEKLTILIENTHKKTDYLKDKKMRTEKDDLHIFQVVEVIYGNVLKL